jgi:cytochrome P450
MGLLKRLFNPIRLLFNIGVDLYITKYEKETKANAHEFRNYIRSMILERKKQMNDPTYQSKGDFLTILLQDDLFKNDEKMMIDECVTFLLAAT